MAKQHYPHYMWDVQFWSEAALQVIGKLWVAAVFIVQVVFKFD
jgi:hypothetical protein